MAKAGRPRKVTIVPEKEDMFSMMEAIYKERNELRARAAHFESMIDEKNRVIAGLKARVASEFQNEIHELITPELAYGKILKEIRLEHGMTIEKMARKLYISNSAYWNMERGIGSLAGIISAYETIRSLRERRELNK